MYIRIHQKFVEKKGKFILLKHFVTPMRGIFLECIFHELFEEQLICMGFNIWFSTKINTSFTSTCHTF